MVKRLSFFVMCLCAFAVSMQCAGAQQWIRYDADALSIKYPDDWEIVNERTQLTSGVAIALQIMQKEASPYDFRPNINIIVGKKREESSYELALISKSQISRFARVQSPVSTTVCKMSAARFDYTWTYGSYVMYGRQYIVKKQDNTVYTITLTVDGSKKERQLEKVGRIFSTLQIK